MLDVVNQNTTYLVTVTVKDTSGVLVVPNSVTYRIDDTKTGTAVKADTVITPAGAIFDISIDASANVCLGTGAYEKRLLTVSATYNLSSKVTAAHMFLVRNISKSS